jgi:glycosyltransferase involved in cell wall biosynthesis
MTRLTVSILTPTYNRRKYIPMLIKCYKNQTYPNALMEWIVVDDGEDSVEDLFKSVKGVRYYRYEEKLKLGKKRNVLNSLAKNDIIVYMDDDDYYPPDRVKHAVTKLASKPQVKVAGSSLMYLYFCHLDKICTVGPYGHFHATAGTFAFRRELLNECKFDDDAECSEESKFLKNYSIPMVQLDPLKTILVISHDTNTFDKKQLIGKETQFKMKMTKLTLKSFCKKKEFKRVKDFYRSIEKIEDKKE